MKNVDFNLLKDPFFNGEIDHMSSSPDEILRIFRWFEYSMKINLSDVVVLDLGCGNGNSMFVINRLGARAVYGVEKDPRYAQIAINFLNEKSLPHNVKIMDYFSDDMMRLRFDDGTDLRGIDIFHLFAYDSWGGTRPHNETVLDNVFLKFAPKGSFFLVHPGLNRRKSFYDERNLISIIDDYVCSLIQRNIIS